jgi:hypothetical protein
MDTVVADVPAIDSALAVADLPPSCFAIPYIFASAVAGFLYLSLIRLFLRNIHSTQK